MPLRRIGVLTAIVVFLFALARVMSVVVDWAWFSSIGYVGVLWTALATKVLSSRLSLQSRPLLLWSNQPWRSAPLSNLRPKHI